jgi:hypothetical protein
MDNKQTEAVIKSLAEELSKISHARARAAAEDEDEQNISEAIDLAFLFRMIPTLCACHISALATLVLAFDDMEDHAPEEHTHQ